jgi:hypothetical protein
MSSPIPPNAIEYRITATPNTRLEKLKESISQRFGAIVVKEFRQTLKGYQIYAMCGLLLLAAATWQSNLFNMFAFEYITEESERWFARFDGYFRILSVPAFIFIPFWLYRSMAVEFKQGAFELVAITSTVSWQIVLGKLVIAMIQFTIYASLLLPFMTLELVTVSIGISDLLIRLGLAVATCLGASAFAIMLATFAHRGVWQVAGMLFILLLGAALVFYFTGMMYLSRMIVFESDLAPSDSASLTVYSNIVVLVAIAIAASCFAIARLQFSSSNQAATTRFGFGLMQWTLFFLILVFHFNLEDNPTLKSNLYMALVSLSIFGGSLLVGNLPYPSRRVLRDNLAWWKRLVWVAWLPGSRRAFLFVTFNHFLITGLLIILIGREKSFNQPVSEFTFDRFSGVMLIGCGYVLTYITIAWLACLPFRHQQKNRAAMAGIVALTMLILGSLVPNIMSIVINRGSLTTYPIYFVTDLFFTIGFATQRGISSLTFVPTILIISSSISVLVAFGIALADEIGERRLISRLKQLNAVT